MPPRAPLSASRPRSFLSRPATARLSQAGSHARRPFTSSVVRTDSRRPTYNRFPQRQPPILSDFNRRVLEIPAEEASSGSSSGGGQRPEGGEPRSGPWGVWDALDGRKRLVVVGLVGASGYYVYHLEQVPETGRWRFMDLSPSTEQATAQQAFGEMLNEYRPLLLPATHPTARYVHKVASRVVKANGLGVMKGEKKVSGSGWGWTEGGEETGGQKDVEWEVFVVKDDGTKNAFVLPGGKIFVMSGILPVCANEDGLASVLGHEIAHQVARHSAERMSALKVLTVLGFALEAAGLDIGISRLLLTFLLSLPNSRRAETEADFIGLRLMSKACFDPREAPKMWVRMESTDTKSSSGWKGAANIDFMSTHPANQKRIRALESWLPEALNVRAASSCADTARSYERFADEFVPARTRAASGAGGVFGGERMGGGW